MKNVIVVIGAGSIGQAIVRRVSAGKHVLLADIRLENADAAAKTLTDAGFERRMSFPVLCSSGFRLGERRRSPLVSICRSNCLLPAIADNALALSCFFPPPASGHP